ncbi:MAG: exodeoxyribonuclease VII large subunit [Bacteroidia bacterium]|nr:exodeoxyribonuclease VII large subunit [Bacteroidia bacterium]
MEAYSLFEVNQYIKRVLALNFDEPFWVECEINQVSDSRGNMYLELIEKDEHSDQIIAKSAGTIWYRQNSFIKKKLGDLYSSILVEGVKVKIKTQLEFNERYGLSLNILDVDASFTLGQFELNRQKILNKLKDKNLLELNGLLDIPTVIRRIAVISSASAAGYQDFKNHLESNSAGYAFITTLFPAAMQGQKTEREVVAAIRDIDPDDYDIIAIIRGGGSKLDLSSFDNYNIAVEIARCPIPVFTGIGHDIDMTVTDIVSCMVLKTPTAVADYILEQNMSFEAEILMMYQQIEQTAKSRLREAGHHLNIIQNILNTGPRHRIELLVNQIDSLHETLFNSARQKISNIEKDLINIEKVTAILDPKKILQRGFVLVKQNNKYITRKSGLERNNPEIQLEFYDGTMRAKSDEK